MESKKIFETPELNKKFDNGKSCPLSYSKFKIIKKIGEGGFGKVLQVSTLYSQNEYAMKVLDKNYFQNQHLDHQVLREIKLQNKCNHPNIVQLYACFEDYR